MEEVRLRCMHDAGGLWTQAFFLGHWQMGGCGMYLWSQVRTAGTAGKLTSLCNAFCHACMSSRPQSHVACWVPANICGSRDMMLWCLPL